LKLLLDEMLDKEIAVQLRTRGRDVRAVQEDAALRGLDDISLLRAAAEDGAVLVTDNVVDFLHLHGAFLDQAESHAGIILAAPAQFPRSKRTIGVWVRALDACLGQLESTASLHSRVHWLSPADELR
jgi:predicted nuclease of predicted toxin-antitoxin system